MRKKLCLIYNYGRHYHAPHYNERDYHYTYYVRHKLYVIRFCTDVPMVCVRVKDFAKNHGIQKHVFCSCTAADVRTVI